MPLVTPDALRQHYDVCVVGTGPGGLACGLGCHEQGHKVLMLEAGGRVPVEGNPDILAADILDANYHAPTDIVSAHALGGTSHWWGGRSVPLDPVDFTDWPISYTEMLPWYEEAGEFLGARALLTSPPPELFTRLHNFDASGEESWCPQVNMADRWHKKIIARQGPAILLDARVIGMNYENARICGIRVLIGSDVQTVTADHVVLACGGLGGLKLLLLAQRDHPEILGGPQGPLGLHYMGHLTGTIANLAFASEGDNEKFAYRELGQQIFVRRRLRTASLLIAQEGIPNTALWIDDARNEDPSHLSSTASAKFLIALAVRNTSFPSVTSNVVAVQKHLRNVVRSPLTAIVGLGHAGYSHLRTRLTGVPLRPRHFMPAEYGAWLLRYHAEQRPCSSNRISLSNNARDSVGLPRLQIDFRFSSDDCDAVVRVHEALDADLRQARAGHLRWLVPPSDRMEKVRQSARDGYHQIGGAIMSKQPGIGIVNPDCRAHGIENLWVASSSVFPSGGQANPTLTIVALNRRLAARLKA